MLNFISPNIEAEVGIVTRRPVIFLVIRKAVLVALVGAAVLYVVYFYLMPRSVDGIRIILAPITLEISGPGLLDARNKVTITARIQGYLKTILVDRNDPVEAGQIIAQLESEDLANQLAAAQANLAAAGHAVAESRSDEDRLKAIAEKAGSDFERKRGLATSGTITEAEWVATQAAFRQSQAELARSHSTIERTVAQAASATANVKLLQVRLNEATIRSPLNGVVVMRDRNLGDLLVPGVSLMQLVDPATIIVSARFDESAMGAIEAGQAVIIRFASAPAVDIKGSILRLIRQVDQETREFTVDITPERLPDHWALGQRANVIVVAQSPTPTISIPQTMMARRGGRVGVWKLQDGRSEWTPVNLGYPSGTSMQVVSGLSPDDIVLAPEGRYWLEPVAFSGRLK